MNDKIERLLLRLKESNARIVELEDLLEVSSNEQKDYYLQTNCKYLKMQTHYESIISQQLTEIEKLRGQTITLINQNEEVQTKYKSEIAALELINMEQKASISYLASHSEFELNDAIDVIARRIQQASEKWNI